MRQRPPVSFVLPCYNGKELMEKYLPSVIDIMDPGLDELIIVDDCSQDGGPDFIRANFPFVRLILMPRNCRFSACATRGVRESKNRLVCLLNTDLELLPGFLEPLLGPFVSPDVFCVSSMQLPPGSLIPDYILPALEVRFGLLYYRYQRLRGPLTKTIEVCWAQDAATVYDREKLLALGGLELIYTPAYWEDMDICLQAWKRGWKSLYEPRSRHYHHHQKNTMSRIFSKFYIRRFHWKNRFLVAWRDFDSPFFWLQQTLFLPFALFFFPLLGKPEVAIGFFMALRQIPDVVRRRLCAVVNPKISDRQIMAKFNCRAVKDCVPVSLINVLYLHETARMAGAENSLLNLARNLDQKSFKPLFVLPEEGVFSEELRRCGIEVLIVDLPKIRKIKGVVAAVQKLCRIAGARNIHIIHSNSVRTHLYGMAAARVTGAATVWHERNLRFGELVDYERLLMLFADRVICNSQAIARRFVSSGKLPPRVRVVFNGVDTEKFNPGIDGFGIRGEFGIKDDQLVIGISSRFNVHKGHEIFLRAAQEIVNKNLPGSEKIRFLIAGGSVFDEDKKREQFLRDMAENLGLQKKVIFTGFRKDMPQVYAAMDIFVLASDAEPCGRVVLEAMASGKPVVATASGGTPEMIIDGTDGDLFKPGDYQDLADKIIYLSNNSSTAKMRGNAARKRVEENFSIQRNVRQIQDVYLELLCDAGK
jgi:glycosyltransferase involved in cell wall biosynthesis